MRLFLQYESLITQIYKGKAHCGIDLVGKGLNGAMCVDYICAHSDGIVADMRNNYATNDKTGSSYGNYVLIKHENGMYTLYAHMRMGSVKVNVGDRVFKNQVIGYMGNTGHSFGAHLHFEVRDIKNQCIDPTPFLEADLPVTEIKEEQPTQEIIYTVKRGDTLWAIASKYLGEGIRYKEIMEANNLKTTIIYPGQVLRIRKG